MSLAVDACPRCLRRGWLLARLAGHIEAARTGGGRLPLLLALPDDVLVRALAGAGRDAVTAEHAGFDAAAAARAIRAAGLEAVCRCSPRHPRRLADLPDPPAVLHAAGGVGRATALLGERAVAVVGARRATPHGLEVARGLGRGLAAAGVTVISGMARGIDSAAHEGALEVGGPTVAVLAGGAERAYPASARPLHRRLCALGAVVSEMPPGTSTRRWCFPARNRLIAALAEAVVVVEAGERSGSLITAEIAAALGRDVLAVPGRVTSALAAGANALIRDGAHLVRHAGDVLDVLLGPGAVPAPAAPALEPGLQGLLEAVGGGHDTVAALAEAGFPARAAMVGLARLELLGLVVRGAGGRLIARPLR